MAVIDNLFYFNDIKEALEILGREKCGYSANSTSEKAVDKFLSHEDYECVEKNGLVAILFSIDVNK